MVERDARWDMTLAPPSSPAMALTPIEQLARWRTLGARHSEDVVHLAPKVLKQGGLGEDEWAIREQFAIAALDLGLADLAEKQCAIISKRFNGSPRESLLIGLQLEARGELAKAEQLYLSLITKNGTNVSAQQRLIALQLCNPNPLAAITSLLTYLDIFYSDPAGWSLLAELYADQGLYAQSMTALGHLMLIQSWDSAAVCRAGETAYTMGDYQLALKHFLRATEMETDPSSPGSEDSRKTRSWWGVKLSIRRLMADTRNKAETSVPSEASTSPSQLRSLDELATERLLAAGGKGMSGRRTILSASNAAIR